MNSFYLLLSIYYLIKAATKRRESFIKVSSVMQLCTSRETPLRISPKLIH